MTSTAAKPKRSHMRGNLYLFLGLVLFLLGSVSILMIRYGRVLGIDRPDEPFLIFGICLALSALGMKMMLKGKKLKTKDAELIMAKGERPIVLYLRSFALDTEDNQHKIAIGSGLSVPVNPWEGGLSSAFGKVADMIAIGRPGEKLATLGATRLYVNDDEWQDKVLEMVAKSELVVWTYGSTEGLKWEISRLVEIVPPEKLVLAIPYWDKKLKHRQEIWQDAYTRLNPVFSKPLPENATGSLFITFDKDWNSQWVETANKKSLPLKIVTLGFINQVTSGVKSLLVEKGYEYPPLSIFEKIGYTALALMAWTVIAVLCVMLWGLFVTFTK
jgi:hypothetical protein